MQPARPLVAVLGVAVAVVSGCAATAQTTWNPDELRAEELRRVPGLAPADAIVPFQVDPDAVARARHAVGRTRSREDASRVLAGALFDPEEFGLRYSPRAATEGADQTLARHEGNCLDLASVFIGLARALGLRAYYVDASIRVHETRDGGDGVTVNAGHITAMVETERGRFGLDFSRQGDIRAYRIITDLEALAHFYNNRGFERIDVAEVDGAAPDWAAAAVDFSRAVKVDPSFARAWNNLGVAAARQGRRDEAVSHYRTAIARDPAMAAPHTNLGLLLLATGDTAGALRELDAAATLAPNAYNTQYDLAVARLRTGDRAGARAALQRAIHLRGTYPEAEALLRTVP